MGGKSRKRTASLVSVAARKKACSQTVNSASIDMNTVNDSTDSEGESYLDLASARSRDERLTSCQRRLLEMEKLVNELKCCIGQQNRQIDAMYKKLNFLLSAMGVAEDGLTPVHKVLTRLRPWAMVSVSRLGRISGVLSLD